MKPRSYNYKLDHSIRAKSEDLIWHMHEYGVDLKSNHIYLFGTDYYQSGVGTDNLDEPGVEFTMANRFVKNMNLCMRVNPKKPIVIHMKTSGGFWEEGMAIYDIIKACPLHVTILNYTHARSMSSIIFQAADKRVMMENSYFMFHRGSIELSGTESQVKSAFKFGNIASQTMLDIYSRRMQEKGEMAGKSLQSIKRWLNDQMDRNEDVYLSAPKAVAKGLADEVFNYDWSSLTKYE